MTILTTDADRMIQEAVDASLSASACNFESWQALEQSPEMDVPVNTLVPGFYLRQAGTDTAHIQLLADAAGSVRLPPILVQRHSSRIIDGMHRFEAAKLCRREHIRARVIDCTDEQALILAVRSNTLHGLPLSKADRVAGAKRILSTNPDWSDRALAEVTGLSTRTIGVLRNRSTDDIPIISKRLGKDGKRRPLSAAEGRKRAAEYIVAHPDAPLRQVAKEADVSLGTVHDVRERIRRGADPVAEPRSARAGRTGSQQKAQGPVGRLSQAEGRDAQNVRARFHGGPRDRNIQNGRLTWPSVSAKLTSDPCLRYTEGGRAFMRWMAAHAAQAEEWREFIDAIPEHWLGEVSLIASNVSAEWQEFAEWLGNKQRSVS